MQISRIFNFQIFSKLIFFNSRQALLQHYALASRRSNACQFLKTKLNIIDTKNPNAQTSADSPKPLTVPITKGNKYADIFTYFLKFLKRTAPKMNPNAPIMFTDNSKIVSNSVIFVSSFSAFPTLFYVQNQQYCRHNSH
jgi:hypothetical protein